MQQPYFFEGVIAEDPVSELGLAADEPQTGRVLVREILGHSNKVSSEDLLPAYIIMPSTSAGIGGVGLSPTGLLKGTRVMCIKFPDQAATYVMGVLNYAPEDNHSVSSYARGQGEPELKAQNRIKGESGSVIEPESKYKAKYPYNNTMTIVAVTYSSSMTLQVQNAFRSFIKRVHTSRFYLTERSLRSR
jgi:hypothetical protein